MATTINLGKVIPQKGVDYFTDDEIAEFKAQATQELQEQINTNVQDITNIKTEQITQNSNIQNLNNTTESLIVEDSNINEKIIALADNYKPNTANGKNIHLTDSASAPIKEIQIGDGEIEQEEEPTPDSPQDVNVVEGSISIQTSNKNIVDFKSFTVLNSNVNASYTDDTLSISGTGTALGVRYDVKDFIKAHPGEKLIFSCSDLDISEYNSGTPNIVVLAINKAGQTSSTNMYNTSGVQTVYTIPDDVDDISTATFRLYSNNSSSVSQTSAIKIVKPQLELRENSTEFVEHEGKTYPLTLPTGMFLGSIGTAKNYIHGTKNNWKFHKDLDKVVLNGSENWRLATTDTENLYRMILNIPNVKGTGVTTTQANIKSNLYQGRTAGSTWRKNEGISVSETGNSILIYDSTYNTSVDEFKSMLATKNLELYYELASPTDETITGETLINQLNAISEMQTYSEETIIYSETENLEPTLKIKYRVDPFIQINNRLDALEARVTLLEG